MCLLAEGLLFAVAVSLATYIPYYIQMLDAYGTQGLGDDIRAIAEYILDLLQALHCFDHYSHCKDETIPERLTLGQPRQFALAVLEFFEVLFLLLGKGC